MPKRGKHTPPPAETEEQQSSQPRRPSGEGRLARTPGATTQGDVVGIAGTGGASGTGAASAKVKEVGAVSGIAAEETQGTSDAQDIAETASTKSGAASGHRRSTVHRGGQRGKLKGTGGEVIPNADNPTE